MPSAPSSRMDCCWITYPKGGQTRGVTDLPATPWWTKRTTCSAEITSVTGYKPVAFVLIDENYTALRFEASVAASNSSPGE